MLSWLSDFVVCSTSLYIWSCDVYIQGLEKKCEVKFSSSDSINNRHTSPPLINFRKCIVGNLLFYKEKVPDPRSKSVCAVEMTMYVLHWTSVNIK